MVSLDQLPSVEPRSAPLCANGFKLEDQWVIITLKGVMNWLF